jgi:hypothetical protein
LNNIVLSTIDLHNSSFQGHILLWIYRKSILRRERENVILTNIHDNSIWFFLRDHCFTCVYYSILIKAYLISRTRICTWLYNKIYNKEFQNTQQWRQRKWVIINIVMHISYLDVLFTVDLRHKISNSTFETAALNRLTVWESREYSLIKHLLHDWE